MDRIITLGEFIIKKQGEFAYATGELTRLLSSLRLAAKLVNSEINKAGLIDHMMGKVGNINPQGEEQQKLDVYANKLFIEAIEARDEVCGIASEEEESYIPFTREGCKNGKYVLLIDPLDGSSNIDVNVSIGTIFSIYRRKSPIGTQAQLEDFLQPGNQQVAAGYIIYGSSTMLVYTTGHGVHGFTFDPAIGVFFLSHPNIQIPEIGHIYSVNEGNFPSFPPGVQRYIQLCRKENKVSSRYIGSMVADFHRNLIKGGIYMYPETESHPNGKLRLLYECNPMAFIAEEAGGEASDGRNRIMDLEPTELHQRVPFYTGSKRMVQAISKMIT